MSDCPSSNPASTSSTGFYYLTSTLPANNTYTLTVSATGYVTQTATVTVPPGNQAAFANVALNEVAPPPPSIVQDVGFASAGHANPEVIESATTNGGRRRAIGAATAAATRKPAQSQEGQIGDGS